MAADGNVTPEATQEEVPGPPQDLGADPPNPEEKEYVLFNGTLPAATTPIAKIFAQDTLAVQRTTATAFHQFFQEKHQCEIPVVLVVLRLHS